MKLELTIEERAFALLVPRSTHGNIAIIRQALQALEALEFTEEERRKFGIQEGVDGSMAWAPASKAEITTIDIKPAVLRWLLKEAKAFSNWPARPCIATLFDKLEALKKIIEEE